MKLVKRLSAVSILLVVLSLFLTPLVVLADTVNFEDQFTNTTASPVSLASWTPTPTGTKWLKVLSRDTATDQLYVSASDFLSPAGSINLCSLNEGAAYTADATYGTADYAAEVLMTTGDTADDYNWLGVRIEGDGDGYWLRFNADIANFAQLYKATAAGVTWTAIGSPAAAAIADGSVVKLEVIGSTLKVYDDGVEIISTTDTDFSLPRQAGIGMGDLTNNGSDDCSGQQLDNFKVTLYEAAGPSTTAPLPITIQYF